MRPAPENSPRLAGDRVLNQLVIIGKNFSWGDYLPDIYRFTAFLLADLPLAAKRRPLIRQVLEREPGKAEDQPRSYHIRARVDDFEQNLAP